MATMRRELNNIESDTTISQLDHMNWLCEQCVVGAPESQRRWMEESNRNFKISVFNTSMISSAAGGGQLGIENGQTVLGGPVYSDEMQAITISTHIIIAKGLKDPDNKIAMAIGTIAVGIYADWNEGRKPLKERIVIRGYPVDVNKYFKKDLPLLEAAFVEWEKRTGVAAAQKLAKEKKSEEKGRVIDATNRRKSDLLANQPSLQKYWQ
jgi:hypothetical protein